MLPIDPYPPAEFDEWARHYDESIDDQSYPFTGYWRVLSEVVRLADVRPGMAILDLGTGTGNLAEMFVALGCEVWGTDFSRAMLETARRKLPVAYFYLHDLRQPFPSELTGGFDRIVSAYVFHHFLLLEKLAIIDRLFRQQLKPGGRLLIADISFPTCEAREVVRQAVSERWDDEPYWVVAEMLPALAKIDAPAAYVQISECAGIYQIPLSQ